MQSNNLYPTQGSPSYGIEATAPFMSITDLVNDMGNQYLMGYVNSDDISLVAPVEIINSGDTVTMSRVSGNFGWGYAQWQYTGSYGPGTLYYNNNGTLTRSWGINYDFNFLNAVEMARVNTTTELIPYISVAAIKSEFIDGYKMTSFELTRDNVRATTLDNFVENTYTVDGWKNIIDNDLPIFSGTITDNQDPSLVFPLTLRPSDFEHDNGMKFALIPTDNGYTLHCRILGLKIGNTKYYYDSSQTITKNIVPFFQFPDIVGNTAMSIPGSLMIAQFDLYYENGGIYATKGRLGGNNYYNEMFLQGDSNENSRIFGGFDFGTLSVNDIDFTRIFSSSSTGWWAFVGNYVLRLVSKSGGRGAFVVNELYTPREIYDYARFWHKRTNTPSESYSAADTVTVFETSETPTFETVSGTLTEIAARLRPWQLPNVDIKSNTFTPEDIPDPEPEPGDDEESGDTIDFIMRSFSGASNFITNYAMTRHQVGIFGNRLWTSWADSLGNPTEMIKNIRIFYTGGDTGSIDIGSVMPFIVSMKIFPFDLSNFIGYETNGIKIGTGHYPIDVPGCWYLPRSSVYISCGTVTIPRVFNDFRDYENMNIMCYVPYCGTVELNPGDVIGRTLSCTYGVDLQSGGCTAYIIVDNNYPVATISGQMGSSVPLTATNSGQLMSQRLSDISGASALIGNTTMQVQRESERPHPKQANMDSAIVGAVLQAADSVPQRFRRSAISCPTMSAGNGLDAFAQPPTPYIQMRYGIYDLPANYKHSIGRISTKSNKLSEYKDTGFITCSNVDTSPLTCHNDEKAAIKAALESGVYI